MGDKGGKGEIPKFPDPGKSYASGIKAYLKYLPKQLRQELQYRQEYDPQFIEQALGIQHKYDPQLYQEQIDALQRRDPEWLAMHRGLGAKISQMLEQGYMDPRQEAAYEKYAALAGRGEPTRDRAYQALGEQVTGDTLRGGTASPETLRQMTQAIMAQRPGLSYGEAQDMATAVYTGQRTEALKSQRQQATGQFLQTATPTAQREASLANFYGMAPPSAQTLAQAGSYLSSPTTTQMMNQIQGVQPPRAFGYVNPNAGYQGQQFALQNYQNQLGYSQMQGGGSGNPWTNALSGASSGASMGSIGGPYGAAGGAIVGGVAGAFGYPQFSDAAYKNNISRTGASTKDGIPIVEYDYNGKRWVGVLAQDVKTVKPEAVYEYVNGRLGVFYSKLGIELKEVDNGDW